MSTELKDEQRTRNFHYSQRTFSRDFSNNYRKLLPDLTEEEKDLTWRNIAVPRSQHFVHSMGALRELLVQFPDPDRADHIAEKISEQLADDFPLFHDLQPKVRRWLCEQVRLEHWEPGATLCQQDEAGRPSAKLYLVLRGYLTASTRLAADAPDDGEAPAARGGALWDTYRRMKAVSRGGGASAPFGSPRKHREHEASISMLDDQLSRLEALTSMEDPSAPGPGQMGSPQKKTVSLGPGAVYGLATMLVNHPHTHKVSVSLAGGADLAVLDHDAWVRCMRKAAGFQALGAVASLRHMSEPMRDMVTDRIEYLSFTAGDTVFHQGDPADKFYVILKGAIRVSVKDVYSIHDLKAHRMAQVIEKEMTTKDVKITRDQANERKAAREALSSQLAQEAEQLLLEEQRGTPEEPPPALAAAPFGKGAAKSHGKAPHRGKDPREGPKAGMVEEATVSEGGGGGGGGGGGERKSSLVSSAAMKWISAVHNKSVVARTKTNFRTSLQYNEMRLSSSMKPSEWLTKMENDKDMPINEWNMQKLDDLRHLPPGDRNLRLIGPGAGFGEMGLTLKHQVGTRNATITCVEDTQLAAVDSQTYFTMVDSAMVGREERPTMGSAAAVLAKGAHQRSFHDVDLLVRFFRDLPIMTPLPWTICQDLCQHLQLETLQGGKILFHQGDIGEKFYIILAGHVRLEAVQESEDGFLKYKHIKTLGPGAQFGELALMRGSGGHRSLTASAEDDCEFATLDKKNYHRIMKSEDLSRLSLTADFLQKCQGFNRWGRTSLLRIVYLMRAETLHKEAVFMRQGEPSRDMVFIKQGVCRLTYKLQVNLHTTTSHDHDHTRGRTSAATSPAVVGDRGAGCTGLIVDVAVLSKLDLIGDLCAISKEHPRYTAICETPCTLLFMGSDDFRGRIVCHDKSFKQRALLRDALYQERAVKGVEALLRFSPELPDHPSVRTAMRAMKAQADAARATAGLYDQNHSSEEEAPMGMEVIGGSMASELQHSEVEKQEDAKAVSKAEGLQALAMRVPTPVTVVPRALQGTDQDPLLSDLKRRREQMKEAEKSPAAGPRSARRTLLGTTDAQGMQPEVVVHEGGDGDGHEAAAEGGMHVHSSTLHHHGDGAAREKARQHWRRARDSLVPTRPQEEGRESNEEGYNIVINRENIIASFLDSLREALVNNSNPMTPSAFPDSEDEADEVGPATTTQGLLDFYDPKQDVSRLLLDADRGRLATSWARGREADHPRAADPPPEAAPTTDPEPPATQQLYRELSTVGDSYTRPRKHSFVQRTSLRQLTSLSPMSLHKVIAKRPLTRRSSEAANFEASQPLESYISAMASCPPPIVPDATQLLRRPEPAASVASSDQSPRRGPPRLQSMSVPADMMMRSSDPGPTPARGSGSPLPVRRLEQGSAGPRALASAAETTPPAGPRRRLDPSPSPPRHARSLAPSPGLGGGGGGLGGPPGSLRRAHSLSESPTLPQALAGSASPARRGQSLVTPRSLGASPSPPRRVPPLDLSPPPSSASPDPGSAPLSGRLSCRAPSASKTVMDTSTYYTPRAGQPEPRRSAPGVAINVLNDRGSAMPNGEGEKSWGGIVSRRKMSVLNQATLDPGAAEALRQAARSDHMLYNIDRRQSAFGGQALGVNNQGAKLAALDEYIPRHLRRGSHVGRRDLVWHQGGQGVGAVIEELLETEMSIDAEQMRKGVMRRGAGMSPAFSLTHTPGALSQGTSRPSDPSWEDMLEMEESSGATQSQQFASSSMKQEECDAHTKQDKAAPSGLGSAEFLVPPYSNNNGFEEGILQEGILYIS